MEQEYVVIYRKGGWASCTWLAIPTGTALTGEGRLEQAKEDAAALERMGYKTIIRSQAEHALLGMPIGWHWRLVDHKRDTIVTSGRMSTHTIPQDRWPEGRDTLERWKIPA